MLIGWSTGVADRDVKPLKVISAFSAAQLSDKVENNDNIRVASRGTLKSLPALWTIRGMPEPTVAFLAVPMMLVVVHPVESLVLHVFPVKPLMQTQVVD